jgi:hypothetical protein
MSGDRTECAPAPQEDGCSSSPPGAFGSTLSPSSTLAEMKPANNATTTSTPHALGAAGQQRHCDQMRFLQAVELARM